MHVWKRLIKQIEGAENQNSVYSYPTLIVPKITCEIGSKVQIPRPFPNTRNMLREIQRDLFNLGSNPYLIYLIYFSPRFRPAEKIHVKIFQVLFLPNRVFLIGPRHCAKKETCVLEIIHFSCSVALLATCVSLKHKYLDFHNTKVS